MGSNYPTKEGSSGTSPDSLNGLKFGQKIYFEDVGPAGKSPVRKGGRRAALNSRPPRCQVEGCKVDLSDVKAYYSRHKVCGMHSKASQVVVNGLQQRFCQQCSRFHLLTEFDNGKRSCRRRLAGHNERRRKPPPGSLLSSRLGCLSSSLFGDGSSRSGGYVLDFSSYARHPGGNDPWPGTTRASSERMPGNQSSSSGKFNMWPGSSGDPASSEMFLQGTGGGPNFSIPMGECMTTGVTPTSESSCALSLLSNTTTSWGSRNQQPSSSGIQLACNNTGNTSSSLMNVDGPGHGTMSECTMANAVTVAHLSNSSSLWGFKGSEALQVVQPPPHDHPGLGQISHGGQFQGDLLMDQFHGGGRQYMEVDHSRAYHSVGDDHNHAHWSL